MAFNIYGIVRIFLTVVNILFVYPKQYDDFVYEAGQHQQPQYNIEVEVATRRRYLLYEVNHGEGFNLRRDVYMRVANLVNQLRQNQDWILVLPPWGHLYHWKSPELGNQMNVPWSHFFDLDSLNTYIPVMELEDFIKEYGQIDMVYSLQYFADTFNEGVEWKEKYDTGSCLSSTHYNYDTANERVNGWFWGYSEIVARNFTCLSLQGRAATLIPLLESNDKHRAIFFDRAEIMLHDSYGDASYWKARRSMRFAKHLRNAGDDFRRKRLNSTDITDGTELLDDWRVMRSNMLYARGGPFIGVHLRRQDFLYSRGDHVPSLAFFAKQIKPLLNRLNLTLIFVATDASPNEFEELKSYLPGAIRYVPSHEEKFQFKDGGIAIIDQWICAHARYFIGTYESTFSFRIYEEREILNFDPDTTFNRLCGDEEAHCEAPSRWRIAY